MKNSVVYNAKFLGMTDVDQPTGIDVVKEAIVKTKFNNQLKLSEGQRPSKVQISISLDGISVLDPKNKDILHYRPLNAISYCADDKMDKGIFTFIAKYPDSNKHSCFVFESEKSAEEITLTIGQSFDLAYQKFVEASSKDLNLKKQFLSLQKRVQDLMQENGQLKKRVTELESLVDPKLLPESEKSKHFKTMSLTRHKSYESNGHTSTPLVPFHAPGKRLNSLPATIQSSVVSSSTPPLLAPPPIAARPHNMSLNSSNSKGQDLFGSPQFVPSPTTPSSITASPEVFSKWPNPFATGCTTDPFGMSIFTPAILAPKSADQQFVDLQSPLISSSSFPVDFSLTELDPLRSK